MNLNQSFTILLLHTCLGLMIALTSDACAEERRKDVTFDDLKFDMKKGDPFERTFLTKPIEDLAGTKIRIRGYMLPAFQLKGITQFVLVRDNQECCFGKGAALFDCVMVEMKDGISVPYVSRPIAVEGIFQIDELKDPEGITLAIYHLDGLSVK